MKIILAITFLFTHFFIYSQNKNTPEIKLSKERIEKTIFLKEIISTIPTDCDIIETEFSFSSKGQLSTLHSAGNEISKSVKSELKRLSKGTVVFIDVKYTREAEKSKKLTLTEKIQIE